MQLTISDVAKYLNVSQRTVYRWLEKGQIPGYKINDQYRFSRAELIEWVSKQKIAASEELFVFPDSSDSKIPSISDCIRSGGIYYRVEGDDKSSVLKSAVSLIKLPDGVDRSFLLQMLTLREEMASTGVGDGIAIPHLRNPIILGVDNPQIALCFLEKAVDFSALDGKKVFCLFLLLSPNPRIHLNLISKLAFILKKEQVKKTLKDCGSREKILSIIENAEKEFRMKSK